MSNDNVVSLAQARTKRPQSPRTYEDAVLETARKKSCTLRNVASIEFEILPRITPPDKTSIHVEKIVKDIGFADSLFAEKSHSVTKVFVWSPGHTEPTVFEELESEIHALMYQFCTASDLFGLAYLGDEKVFELGSSILALGTITYDDHNYPVCPVFERNEKNGKSGLYSSKAFLIFPDDVLLLRDLMLR